MDIYEIAFIFLSGCLAALFLAHCIFWIKSKFNRFK